MNTRKTCVLKVGSRHKVNTSRELRLQVNGNILDISWYCFISWLYNRTQYLQWDTHINALVPKLSQKLGILKHLKRYVTQSHLINLYKTIFQPCIDYCITVWGYAADKYLNKVQRIMNRAARIITGNFEYDIRGVELLRQLGLMNLKERRDYFLNLLVFKCVNDIAQAYLCDVLTPAASIRTRESRSIAENLLYVPYVNCDLFMPQSQMMQASYCSMV